MPSTIELSPVFDGNQSPEEILEIVSRIQEKRGELGNVIIEGFHVTEESSERMLKLMGSRFNILLRNTKLPDGSVRDFHHFSIFVDWMKAYFPDVVNSD